MRKITCKIKERQEDHFVQQERFPLESDDEIYTYMSHNICDHYLLSSIFEIKSPPMLAISAKIASLLISALTSSSSPALTGTVE